MKINRKIILIFQIQNYLSHIKRLSALKTRRQSFPSLIIKENIIKQSGALLTLTTLYRRHTHIHPHRHASRACEMPRRRGRNREK